MYQSASDGFYEARKMFKTGSEAVPTIQVSINSGVTCTCLRRHRAWPVGPRAAIYDIHDGNFARNLSFLKPAAGRFLGLRVFPTAGTPQSQRY